MTNTIQSVDLVDIHLFINGKPVHIRTHPARTLLDVLREDLDLTGTKCGCGIGECGACTVLLDGQAVNSCLTLIGQLDGRHVRTIEGLAVNGRLHPVQKAFLEEHALQCGFCTPGFIMSTVGLLEKTPHPTEEQIRQALSGNLCRCTGYTRIMAAVNRAAQEMAIGGGND